MVGTRKIPDPAQHGGRPYASSCTLVRRESFRNPTCPTTPGPRSRRAPPRNPAVGCAFQLLGLPRGSPISESRRRSGGHEYAPPRLQRRRQLSPRPSWRPRWSLHAQSSARPEQRVVHGGLLVRRAARGQGSVRPSRRARCRVVRDQGCVHGGGQGASPPRQQHRQPDGGRDASPPRQRHQRPDGGRGVSPPRQRHQQPGGGRDALPPRQRHQQPGGGRDVPPPRQRRWQPAGGRKSTAAFWCAEQRAAKRASAGVFLYAEQRAAKCTSTVAILCAERRAAQQRAAKPASTVAFLYAEQRAARAAYIQAGVHGGLLVCRAARRQVYGHGGLLVRAESALASVSSILVSEADAYRSAIMRSGVRPSSWGCREAARYRSRDEEAAGTTMPC